MLILFVQFGWGWFDPRMGLRDLRHFDVGRLSGLSWHVLNAISSVLIKGNQGRYDYTEKEQRNMTPEAENGDMQSWAKECQWPPKAQKAKEHISPEPSAL